MSKSTHTSGQKAVYAAAFAFLAGSAYLAGSSLEQYNDLQASVIAAEKKTVELQAAYATKVQASERQAIATPQVKTAVIAPKAVTKEAVKTAVVTEEVKTVETKIAPVAEPAPAVEVKKAVAAEPVVVEKEVIKVVEKPVIIKKEVVRVNEVKTVVAAPEKTETITKEEFEKAVEAATEEVKKEVKAEVKEEVKKEQEEKVEKVEEVKEVEEKKETKEETPKVEEVYQHEIPAPTRKRGNSSAKSVHTVGVCQTSLYGAKQCVEMTPKDDASFTECLADKKGGEFCVGQWAAAQGLQTCDSDAQCRGEEVAAMPTPPVITTGCVDHFDGMYCPHRPENECVTVNKETYCQPAEQEIIIVKQCDAAAFPGSAEFAQRKNKVVCSFEKLSKHVIGEGEPVEKFRSMQSFEDCTIQANNQSKTMVYDFGQQCRFSVR